MSALRRGTLYELEVEAFAGYGKSVGHVNDVPLHMETVARPAK